jgi:hypothetical protein
MSAVVRRIWVPQPKWSRDSLIGNVVDNADDEQTMRLGGIGQEIIDLHGRHKHKFPSRSFHSIFHRLLTN